MTPLGFIFHEFCLPFYFNNDNHSHSQLRNVTLMINDNTEAIPNSIPPHLLLLNLPLASQMTVWGVRLLSKGFTCDIAMTSVLMDGFKRCNAVKAASSLDFLMEIIFQGLNRSFEINCPCSPVLGIDEAHLIRIISNSQKSRYDDILRDLNKFLVSEAVKNASYLILEYGDALRTAGLIFPYDKIIENYLETLTIRTNPISGTVH